ncbi:MAG: ribonuclease Z [Chloroflexi bacterium]|nr:ribonuclease Z [Chloroflexota bacterium]
MFEIVFLGTSASAPSVERGLSSGMVIQRGERWMIDCGEGTQRQLLRSGLGFRRLNAVLLTHGHLDHILGLGGIVSTFARWEAVEQMQIIGGRWAVRRVRDLMNVVLRTVDIRVDLQYIEIQDGSIHDSPYYAVRAFPVTHRGPDCFAYEFEEKSRRPFLADKADALGVPFGPERKRLVAGERITLANGQVIEPDEVLGDLIPGIKLVWVGDVARTDEVLPHARNADALVIEATFLQSEQDEATRYGHLTAAQAATLAREAGVRRLFLNHLSRRYHARQVEEEAQAIFPNTVVANDLDHFTVSRGSESLAQ